MLNFVFCRNFVVFRNQLKVDNEFYSPNPPDDESEEPAIPSPVSLCSVCGCRGPLSCSRCKKITYCSQVHQKHDWKIHKSNCNTETNNVPHSDSLSSMLFPEFELVMEAEPSEFEEKKPSKETEEEANQRRLKEFEQLEEEGKTGDFKEVPETELSQYAQTADEVDDKTFRKFKKRTQRSPDQVLRYHRKEKAEPLWITDKVDFTIKDCENCGFERTFEFQIMPQLLNHLNDDKLDWGVLAVYTCKNDCSVVGGGYSKEFLVKQDISS